MKEEKKYEVKIIDGSRTLTNREIVKYTNLTSAISLADQEKGLVLLVKGYVKVQVNNEYSKDNSIYDILYLETDEGIYKTSSETFIRNFKNIWNQMKDEIGEGLEIVLVNIPSNNFKGNNILSCNLV